MFITFIMPNGWFSFKVVLKNKAIELYCHADEM